MRFSRGVGYQWGLFKRKISSKSLELFLRYGQKTSKMPQKWGFSPICDPPRFFFKNRALSLLCPYGALTSCKKLDETNERSLRYLKTDHGPTDQLTDGQGRLLRTPSGEPWVQNSKSGFWSGFLDEERGWKMGTGILLSILYKGHMDFCLNEVISWRDCVQWFIKIIEKQDKVYNGPRDILFNEN